MGAPRKIITLCLWRRPTYTKRVLDSLRRCDGISDYTIIAHCDGAGEHVFGPPQVQDLVREIDFCDSMLVEKRRWRGCNRNTFEALSHGFGMSDYVIHLEDDTELARDTLRYFEFARELGGNPELFCVSAWRHPSAWKFDEKRFKHERQDYTAFKAAGFWIWGWATWRDRWEQMRENWTQTTDKELSWDTHISQNVRGRRYSLCPYTGRVQNIGSEAGTHRGDCVVPYWIETPGHHEPKPWSVEELKLP